MLLLNAWDGRLRDDLLGCNFAAYDLQENLASQYSHLLAQNEIPLDQTCSALKAGHQQGLITLFNPSPVPSKSEVQNTIPWDCVDWLLVNIHEAESLAMMLGKDTSYPDVLERLAQALPKTTGIIVTKGAQGVDALLKAENGSHIRLTASAGKARGPIIDTTGAGDTFAVSQRLIASIKHR